MSHVIGYLIECKNNLISCIPGMSLCVLENQEVFHVPSDEQARECEGCIDEKEGRIKHQVSAMDKNDMPGVGKLCNKH